MRARLSERKVGELMRLVGYFIRRTWKREPHPGKTLVPGVHRLYPTKQEAIETLAIDERAGNLDDRFTYDVAEAWMRTEGK